MLKIYKGRGPWVGSLRPLERSVCGAMTDQTTLNGHRRGLALVQRVNGDIFLQFALVRARWKK